MVKNWQSRLVDLATSEATDYLDMVAVATGLSGEALVATTQRLSRKQFGAGTDDHLLNLVALQARVNPNSLQGALAKEIETILSKEDPSKQADNTNRLKALADGLREQGKYKLAEPIYRLLLERARLFKGEQHAEYGTALNNLAALLQATGRYEEAEKLYRQALENARVALGDDHPEFGIRLNNLAGLLEATGRFVEAEPLFRQAVAVLEKSLGPEHPNTKTIKANYEHFLTNHPPAD